MDRYTLNAKTMGNVNDMFLRTLGISYEEYDNLDFDEQQKLIREYHKNHPKKETNKKMVMVGSGEHAIFVELGLTLEEEQRRLEKEYENELCSKPVAFVKKLARKIER